MTDMTETPCIYDIICTYIWPHLLPVPAIVIWIFSAFRLLLHHIHTAHSQFWHIDILTDCARAGNTVSIDEKKSEFLLRGVGRFNEQLQFNFFDISTIILYDDNFKLSICICLKPVIKIFSAHFLFNPASLTWPYYVLSIFIIVLFLRVKWLASSKTTEHDQRIQQFAICWLIFWQLEG